MRNIFSPGSIPVLLRATLGAIVLLAAPAVVSLAQEGEAPSMREVHVDPDATPQVADGSAARPFATLSAALASIDRSVDHVVRLAAGELSAGSGEPFPIQIPRGTGQLVISGSGAGDSVIRAEAGTPAHWILGEGHAEQSTRLRVENVLFAGGARGLVLIGGNGPTDHLQIRQCRFEGQKLSSLQGIAAAGGSLDVVVSGCQFGTVGAPQLALRPIDLLARRGGELNFRVEDCSLQGGVTSLPALHSGVSVFVDELARVTGRIARNHIVDAGHGILVTSAERWHAARQARIDIVGNTVASRSDDEPGLLDALHIAAPPEADLRLRVAHNTFFGGRQHAIHWARPGGLLSSSEAPPTRCDGARLEALANIFAGFGADPIRWTESTVEASDCFDLRDNVFDDLPQGLGLEVANGILASEDLVRTPSGGYEPAPGSTLLDAGEYPPPTRLGGFEAELLEMERDGGNGPEPCRVRDADGDGVARPDIGAVELDGPGACLTDLAPFTRGDCSSDGLVDITDAIFLLSHLFLGDSAPACPDACDTDDGGFLEITDAIFLLTRLFLGGEAPPAPHPDAGLDPTGDELPVCVKPR